VAVAVNAWVYFCITRTMTSYMRHGEDAHTLLGPSDAQSLVFGLRWYPGALALLCLPATINRIYRYIRPVDVFWLGALQTLCLYSQGTVRRWGLVPQFKFAPPHARQAPLSPLCPACFAIVIAGVVCTWVPKGTRGATANSPLHAHALPHRLTQYTSHPANLDASFHVVPSPVRVWRLDRSCQRHCVFHHHVCWSPGYQVGAQHFITHCRRPP
jgi:hypothetical protein